MKTSLGQAEPAKIEIFVSGAEVNRVLIVWLDRAHFLILAKRLLALESNYSVRLVAHFQHLD